MNLEIRKSFSKDVAKLSPSIKILIGEVIEEVIEKGNLSEIVSCKKLTGFKNAYRIRLGNYRIGFFYEKNTIEFVRVLHRKDIYKHFP